MSTNKSSRCAACKYLRKSCPQDCILAPHFPSACPERFDCVHQIFQIGRVTRMLEALPTHQHAPAADCIAYEAYCRVQDPVYGCAGIISNLQQQINLKQQELAHTKAQIVICSAQNQQSQQYANPPYQNTENQDQELLIFDQPLLDLDRLPDFM